MDDNGMVIGNGDLDSELIDIGNNISGLDCAWVLAKDVHLKPMDNYIKQFQELPMKSVVSFLALSLVSFSALAGLAPPPVGTVPEPSTWALLGISAVGMYLARKRK